MMTSFWPTSPFSDLEYGTYVQHVTPPLPPSTLSKYDVYPSPRLLPLSAVTSIWLSVLPNFPRGCRRPAAAAAAAAGAFGLGTYVVKGKTSALEFFAGYIVEQSLSVDNLFIFIMLFDYFKVPSEFQVGGVSRTAARWLMTGMWGGGGLEVALSWDFFIVVANLGYHALNFVAVQAAVFLLKPNAQ